MEVIEKEEFAFQLLNDLSDNYDLHPDDYTKLVGQIQEANTHQAMNSIIRFLQIAILRLIGDVTLIDQDVA